MVLTDAERIDPEIVGEDGFLHHVTEHTGLRLERAVRPECDIAERIKAELESFWHRV